MATPLLNPLSTPDLMPATALWKAYGPQNAPRAFHGKSRAEMLAWQKKARRALAACVALEGHADLPFQAKCLESAAMDGYVREKWTFRPAPHTLMPFYVLKPMGKGPFPVVLAFHGHGYGAKDVVAINANGEDRTVGQGYHKDFAVTLARMGLAVAVPEISCFGEHKTDFSHLAGVQGVGAPGSCHHTATLAAHLGKTAVGMRVGESMRLVDFLSTRKDLDTSRLGAMGISGGGLHAFYSTMLDPRIKAVVVSGYFNSFRASIFAFQHCTCNFVAGLGAFGEMWDLAALVAPRPMLVESGSTDPIFPQAEAKKAVARAKAHWKRLGAGPWPRGDFFEGGHEINGKASLAFLKKELAGG